MMAKRKKDETEAPQGDEAPKARRQPHKDAVISQSKLVSLMKAKRGAKKDTAEINGQLGNLIREAVENNHLHRKAYSTICQLDAMENEKIADYLDHFFYYLDISGIQKRADSVMRMDVDSKEEEGDDEGETSNVAKFPAQAAAE